MLKILRCNLVLLVSLLVFCYAAGSIAAEGGSPSPFEGRGSRWLVSPELLAAGNLEIVWQNELPMKKSESLERLFIPFDLSAGRLGDRIYALSENNYLVSLNREKGNVIFSRPIAPVGFPVLGLELYRGELLSIIGNKLVEINPEFGTERSAKRLGFSATCPAARNSSYFYLGGVDRRMHTLRAADKVQVFEVAADNNSKIVSIVAAEEFVVFATDAGNVISIRPDRPSRLWQLDAADGIVGPIVMDAGVLFVASKDTNVYKIDILTGKLIWKVQMPAVLERAPRVTQEVVYQYVRDKGLAAIDKESGELLWQLAEGVDLLAEAEEKAYVITNVGTLVVMDNKSCKQLYSVNFAQVSRYVANVEDSKIYIANETGRIACLKPASNELKIKD